MKCVGAGKHLRTCRAVLKSKTVVPHCDLLHLFPVCPAEGSRPHIIIKGRTFLVWMLLCVCVCTDSTWLCTVCVCVCACAYGHAEMHVWMLYMHVGIWASACAWGLSQVIAHVCSGNCCDVLSSSLQEVFSQLETKQKMTPAYACSSARRCLSLSVPSDASLELNGREVWKMSTSKRVQASTNPQIMTGRPAWT